MKTWRLALVTVAGALFVILAIWQIRSAEEGLLITRLAGSELPVTIFAPSGVDPASRPVVLIGHGFAGSQVVMRSFALDLAHAGYTVLTWDFNGHGRNPLPLGPVTMTVRTPLVANAEEALDLAGRQGLLDPTRVAILGHSMGSGVALLYGQEHPGTAATIAVSPVGQPVTIDLPHNLLLMAGTNEESFLESARRRLAEAGGEGGDLQAGTARRLVPILGANHLTILFSQVALDEARQWLDETFGVQSDAVPFNDSRMLWYLVGMFGSIAVGIALVELSAGRTSFVTPTYSIWRRIGALALGALGATLVLWLAGQAGLNVTGAFGLLVGGYVLVWFAAAGVLALLFMGMPIERTSSRALAGGLLAFATLWLGVGLLGSRIWQPWLLIPRRLVYWLPGALLALPWFLALGQVLRGAGWLGQLGGWLLNSLLLMGGMLLALQLDSSLGFMILILPVFPVILLLHALVNIPQRGGWAFALSGALFISWLVLAVFPLR